jgi:hypothetical protein
MDFAKTRDWFLRRDWRLRGAVVGLALTVLLLLGLRSAGLWPDPAAVVAAIIVAIVATALFFKNLRGWFRRMDWRVAAILLATAIAVAATLIVFALGLGRNPADFFGAILASWVGGVALFAVVGVVVAVVSLAQPEEESVESRARILFRGQKGRHVDYIVARIRQVFEQYAEDVSNMMTVSEYDASDRKFLVLSEGTTRVRGYIDDAPSTYKSEYSHTGVASPPPGGNLNRVVYLRVGQQNFGGSDIKGSAFSRPFDTTIAAGEDCIIADGIESWVIADDEENSYTPVRFCQRVRLTIRNHLRGGVPLRIKLSLDEGKSFDELTLRSGESRLICEVRDVEPEKTVYDVRYLA